MAHLNTRCGINHCSNIAHLNTSCGINHSSNIAHLNTSCGINHYSNIAMQHSPEHRVWCHQRNQTCPQCLPPTWMLAWTTGTWPLSLWSWWCCKNLKRKRKTKAWLNSKPMNTFLFTLQIFMSNKCMYLCLEENEKDWLTNKSPWTPSPCNCLHQTSVCIYVWRKTKKTG